MFSTSPGRQKIEERKCVQPKHAFEAPSSTRKYLRILKSPTSYMQLDDLQYNDTDKLRNSTKMETKTYTNGMHFTTAAFGRD